MTPGQLSRYPLNEDPADDRPENLELTTRAAHLETHRPQHDQAKRAASLRAAADRMGADERRARALRVWETRRARGT